MATAPRVFTIPASTPFVPTLIRALIDGTLVPGFPAARDPLALAGATLYLPTRRACRLARRRGAGFAAGARRARTPPAAGPTRAQVGGEHRARCARRGAARRQ